MAKTKAGLHKEISAIFDGVPIPKSDGVKQASSKPAPSRIGYVPLKPTAPYPQTQTPAVPKPHAPVQPLPHLASDKHPNIGVQAAEQSFHQPFWTRITSKLSVDKAGVSPARQKATVIAVLILFIILVFVLIRTFGTGAFPQSSDELATIELAKTPAVVKSDIRIDWQVPPLYPKDLRDPTEFDSVAPGQADIAKLSTAELIVTGITYSKDEQYAIVGTQIVRDGDMVSGATVVRISEDRVEFEMDGKRWSQTVQSVEKER